LELKDRSTKPGIFEQSSDAAECQSVIFIGEAVFENKDRGDDDDIEGGRERCRPKTMVMMIYDLHG